MNDHERTCMCLECLNRLAGAADELVTLALDWQIKASWHGWPVDENGPYAGYQPWLPVIPTNSWHLWFERQDAPRRGLIRAKVEVVLEAQLIARES
jgi:hypothetical protein